MRKITWTPIILFHLVAAGLAQEEAVGTSRFFRGKRISFWGEAKDEAPKVNSSGAGSESIWAEPIRMPDGRISVYVPPRPVLEFLESPSEDSGRAYLAWQKARMEKISRASEILGRLAQESRPAESRAAPRNSPENSPPANVPSERQVLAVAARPDLAIPSGTAEILYFKKDGCPHCRREDAAIAELVKERPDVKVRVITPEQEEALWEALEIKVVPTLVVRGKDGRLHIARGYTPKEVLLEKVGASSGGVK